MGRLTGTIGVVRTQHGERVRRHRERPGHEGRKQHLQRHRIGGDQRNGTATDSSLDQWQFASADFRDNVLCLSCHAGHGDYASVTKQDVANVHIAADYFLSQVEWQLGEKQVVHSYNLGTTVTW